MLDSRQLRELLIADLAVVRGAADASDVAAALQRFWNRRELSVAKEIVRIGDLAPDGLRAVEAEADRLIAQAGGDTHLAWSRRGGLDRSIHLALGEKGAPLSLALTQVGAGARSPLRTLPSDRYTEFAVTGEGGMGIVYVAIDTELNRQVAFKMVRPDAGEQRLGITPSTPLMASRPRRNTPASSAFETLKARFLQEAWVTGGLEHPGIVPVYELGQTPAGIPYYTMRFVRGQRTLKRAIDEVRSAPVEDRLQLLEPLLKVCDTIAYAHSRGLLHRDLKPDNIALGQFGEVVVLDWGLAKLEGREDLAASKWQERVHEFREEADLHTVAGAFGTPGYMSPEAAAGLLEQVDASSDVYSLGVILYEILTGRPPYEFTTYAEYLDLVSNRDPPEANATVPGVPQGLSHLCGLCLERDRSKRLGNAADLSRAIRRWQAASAVEREVEGLLRDTRATLDAAESSTGDQRLQQVDRAAAALSQVAAKLPHNPDLQAYRERAETLREAGIRERERTSGRRLLLRVGIAALVVATITAVVMASILEGRRRKEEQSRIAAERARAVAARERNAKDEALQEVLRLSDSKLVRDMLSAADELWPVHPSRADAMARWLAATSEVLARRSDHADRLARLRERALPYAEEQRGRDHAASLARLEALREELLQLDEEHCRLTSNPFEDVDARCTALEDRARVLKAAIAQLTVEVSERRTFTFESRDSEWMHQVLTDLLSGLDRLETAVGEVEGRRESALEMRRLLATDHADLWRETAALLESSAHYPDLRLDPQLGLVPLGTDPDSGLLEFAHHGSGRIPVRDPETRHLVYEDDTAIVLVLVPGGTFLMGSQKQDPDGPNYDAASEVDECDKDGRPWEVTLSPFFLAKHECTQAQWQRLTGGLNPSYYPIGTKEGDQIISPRCPVEQVTWVESDLWLRRWNLVLPTEAQWEYACRAGTDTPWSSGREASSLQGFANIADAGDETPVGEEAWPRTVGVDDGYPIVAPVGVFRPNAFGLHDMHGNVWEWCRDLYGRYATEAVLAPWQDGDRRDRVDRGGAWLFPARCARSADRSWSAPEYRSSDLGCRPARPVTFSSE